MTSSSPPDQSDVIVIGSGHNALISAAYLATAGLRVLVLEGYKHPGGNTMTEELTLPGFRHDSCSTAHTLIQANPLIQKNELGLEALGLRYVLPDPVFVVPFRDGESITMYRDVERTVEEIGGYSRHDADAYRELLTDWEKLRPLQAAERNAAPRTPEETNRLWRSGPLGDEGLRIRMASGLDIIRERFEEPHVRSFVAWIAMMTLEPIDHPFTGILPFSLLSGRQQNSWAIPAGGSDGLVHALLEIIRTKGGDVVCDSWVDRIVTDDNRRVVGVVTRSGMEYRAGKAVLSSAHIKQLPEMLEGGVDAESRAYVDRWSAGLTMFVSHYALSEAPRYRTRTGETTAVAMGAIESLDNLSATLADFRRGRLHLENPFLLALNASVVDPSRAPAGQHTLKVISTLPYQLAEGPERWDAIKEEVAESLLDSYLSYTVNLTRAHVIASATESPLDLERRNPNNFHGSCHGGSAAPSQSGWYRPAPDWNGYRTPVEGFYLTGACTHPGGSVSGFPGRNAARVMLEDFDVAWEDVLTTAQAVPEVATSRPL